MLNFSKSSKRKPKTKHSFNARITSVGWRQRTVRRVASHPVVTSRWPPGELLLNNAVLDCCPLAPMHENITLSIKPEVHNISQRRQRTTEPPSQATCTKNLVKLVVRFTSYAHGQTDRQPYRHTHHNNLHPFCGEMKTIMTFVAANNDDADIEDHQEDDPWCI